MLQSMIHNYESFLRTDLFAGLQEQYFMPVRLFIFSTKKKVFCLYLWRRKLSFYPMYFQVNWMHAPKL